MAQEEVAAVAGTAQPAAQAPEEAELGNAADAIGSTKLQLQRVLADMEQLGIVTELAGKVVGGVALSASYYQHVLATEGRTDQVPPCQLLITRHRRQELLLLPAAQAELEAGHAGLPREAPVLSKMMSPAALTELHWLRVPAVVIFGCFVADEEELQEAVASGIPVSPSLAGPHADEQVTQMEVFFKQYTYPEHKCFILRDWGFLVCGSDLPDAMAAFDERLKETLVLSTEAGDTLGGGGADGGGTGVTSRQSERSSDSGAGGGSKGPGVHVALSQAFKRLQEKVGLLRANSEPAPEIAAAAAAAGGGGRGEGAPQFHGLSEPSSPMLAGGMAGEALPDNIRTISTAARRKSSEFRVPSVQAGLRPW